MPTTETSTQSTEHEYTQDHTIYHLIETLYFQTCWFVPTKTRTQCKTGLDNLQKLKTRYVF